MFMYKLGLVFCYEHLNIKKVAANMYNFNLSNLIMFGSLFTVHAEFTVIFQLSQSVDCCI